uniref:Uncharacterized protein n=1 Tax=Magallana gigas TaxID=29159 RepID=A0A8W8JDP6_MAGGI
MADHIHWATFLICTFVSFVCDCKPLDRYKFPVNTTVSCPRNQTEWNERSSAINCTQGNGFLCLPNEELTELLEFCYFDHRILIEKGTCMYLRNRDSFLDDYDCRNFVDGCPNTTYRINEIYKYESCLSIGNGCFLADPTCVSTTATYSISENSSTTTSEDTTQKTNYERNNLVWIATLLGAITLICIPVVMCFLKIKGTLHLTPADASTKLETNQAADEIKLIVSDEENDITEKSWYSRNQKHT